MLQTLALLVVFTSAATVSSATLVCPVNSQSFISTNRNLLPIENIMSTSESGSNPTANFVNIGNAEPAWCTGGSADTVVGQYVELNFTEPVVIALLMSGGFTSVFVNNFTIHSTMSSTGEDFQPYGILKNPQDFLVPDIETANANFVLGEQMVARRLRFVVNGGMLDPLNNVCWKIILYGCTMAEAQQLQVVETPQTAAPSTSPAPSTTASPDTFPVHVTCTGNQGEAASNMLLIILPAILGVIVIIIVVVAIVMCICCVKSVKNRTLYKSTGESGRYQTREAIDNGTTTPSSSTMHYDNPRSICYDVPRSMMRSRQNSESTLASQAEVKNPIYATKKCVQDFHESPYHLPPDVENDYEDIPGSPTELENRTASNTNANGGVSPMKSPPPPLPLANGVILDGPKAPSDVSYTQVNKMRSREKDAMEMESDMSPPPVINSHYVSTSNTVLAQEIDRLVTDLENSRAIARQW